jgi:hypothetical protein
MASAASGNLDNFEEAAHDVIGRHLFRIGLVRQHNPVAQNIGAHGFDILGGDVSAVPQESVRARRKNERNRRAW